MASSSSRPSLPHSLPQRASNNTAPCRFWVVTTSRADYGLLLPLYHASEHEPLVTLEWVVTGSHFSHHHGHTVDALEADGVPMALRLDMGIEEDSAHTTIEGLSTLQTQLSQALANTPNAIRPHGFIVLGDRQELLPVATVALIHQLPLIHIAGGELTEGAMDDAIRHSVTKIACLHFPSIVPYGQRLLQLGEPVNRIHVVGALGLDNILHGPRLSLDELNQRTGLDFSQPVALATYHPVTRDGEDTGKAVIEAMVDALMSYPDMQILFTSPNMDPGWESIQQAIEATCHQHPNRVVLVPNLGQAAYLSAMAHATLMVGNTSSGILESASFGLPVINIGPRQDGRLRPGNIIDTPDNPSDLANAITQAMGADTQQACRQVTNPYGDGHTAPRIMATLRSLDWTHPTPWLHKVFYDYPVSAELPTLEAAGSW